MFGWMVLCHASAFAGFFVPRPDASLAPLVWLLKRDESQRSTTGERIA
jgi:uncharacterized Tic20 family protein